MSEASPRLQFIFSQIGRDLRSCRKHKYPNDRQSDFAIRIGVGRATYAKMEKGGSKVAIESYFRALELLGMTDRLEGLFAPKPPSGLEGIVV